MQDESQSLRNQQDSTMTFALVIVVIVFIICQAPRLVWFAMQNLSKPFDTVWCYIFQILCLKSQSQVVSLQTAHYWAYHAYLRVITSPRDAS